jgi:molybdate transport system substrate-binding protein
MKNQMAKRIASVLLAGVMLVSLVACGENKKTEEKKTAKRAARKRQRSRYSSQQA